MFDTKRLSICLTAHAMLWLIASTVTVQAQLAPTPQTGAGPMYRSDAPATVNLWQPGDTGQPLHIDGWVRSTDGKPIVGATLNVWQADATGSYHEDRYRATLRTGKDGKYRFSTVLPGQYYSAKHIHVAVTHEAYEDVVTRILFKGDPHLDEVTTRELAIPLEEGTIKGKTFLFGRFDIVMRPIGQK